MEKKKVLVFIDWFLPGYRAGGPIRSCANLIGRLSDEYEFSVVTRDTDYMDDEQYPSVKPDEWNTLADGTRVFYFSNNNLSRKAIRRLIEKEPYDAVYLNGIYSACFTLYPLMFLRRKRDKLVVIATRGMLAKSALSVKSTKKRFFLTAVKVLGLFNKVIFHATNYQEEKDIRNVFGRNAMVRIAPNLVEKETAALPKREKNKEGLRLVSVARIAPEKNTKYALEVLARVKCEVQFDLYGPVYDRAYWEECQQVIRSLPKNIKAEYKGSLEAERVAATLAGYDLLFLPTTGENFGHVIVQAMSAGVPVIISDRTMWTDLAAKKAGWDIPLSSPEQFATLITACSALSEKEYALLCEGAYALAAGYINNKENIELNRKLFLNP